MVSRPHVLLAFGMALVLSAALRASAQEDAMHPPTIVSQGQATVDVVPDYVEFWFHKGVIEASLQQATVAALQFGPQLRKEVEARKLASPDIAVYGPVLPDVKTPYARTSVRLRFATSRFSDPENGPKLFAELCDAIRDIAKALGLPEGMSFDPGAKPPLEGPLFRLENPAGTERAAVSQAVENAYPHAEAVAQTMRAQITAVESVQIDQVTWGENATLNPPGPDYRRLSCMAKVTVTYALSLTQP